MVTETDIKILEVASGAKHNVISLYRFNSKPQSVCYDSTNDCLYFIDTATADGADELDHLYRLDLSRNFFDEIIKRFRAHTNEK